VLIIEENKPYIKAIPLRKSKRELLYDNIDLRASLKKGDKIILEDPEKKIEKAEIFLQEKIAELLSKAEQSKSKA